MSHSCRQKLPSSRKAPTGPTAAIATPPRLCLQKAFGGFLNSAWLRAESCRKLPPSAQKHRNDAQRIAENVRVGLDSALPAAAWVAPHRQKPTRTRTASQRQPTRFAHARKIIKQQTERTKSPVLEVILSVPLVRSQ